MVQEGETTVMALALRIGFEDRVPGPSQYRCTLPPGAAAGGAGFNYLQRKARTFEVKVEPVVVKRQGRSY
jgi:hypothetical protein